MENLLGNVQMKIYRCLERVNRNKQQSAIIYNCKCFYFEGRVKVENFKVENFKVDYFKVD